MGVISANIVPANEELGGTRHTNGLVYGYPITRKTIYGTEAQVVEQSAHNRLVEGSSPSRSTTHTGRVKCDNPASFVGRNPV